MVSLWHRHNAHRTLLSLAVVVLPLFVVSQDKAAQCVATWSTGDQEFSMIAGARALFTYHVASEILSDNPGFYTVMLYRSGSYSPVKIYVYFELFPATGVTNHVWIAPAEYGYVAGDYRVVVEAEDMYSFSRCELLLHVDPAPSISGTVDPTRGQVPFAVRFTASAKDFPGGVEYISFDFGEGIIMSGSQTAVTKTYQFPGTFHPKVTAIGANPEYRATTNLPAITADPPVALCSVQPATGKAPWM